MNAGIDFIARMAVDGFNNIFFFENSFTTTYRTRVRRITPDGKINAYAGSLSASTFSGDGGPALAAGLGNISDIAADAQGNLYILAGYNRVRKVAPNGVITTIAGNGLADLTGDGGPASSASLINPTTIAVDTTGNLYVAGSLGLPFSTPRHSYHIRKITPDGIISTIAGYSKTGFAGDGGPATKATFFLPWAMTFDSAGNLYIVDVGDHRVRKVTPDGIVSAFAGDGRPDSAGDGGPAVDAGMSPWDVAVDMSGNAYVADGNRIRRVTPDGLISTVVGDGMCGFTGDGGPGVQAEICFAGGLAADTQGNVYIADAGNHRIRKLDANGTINTVAGTGSTTASGDGGLAVNAGLDSLGRILVDSQKNLFLSQLNLRSIRRIGPGGIISTFAGNRTQGYSGDGGPATSASLGDVLLFISPPGTFFNYGLATDQAGAVYISIPGNHGGERIRRVTPDGIIQTIAGNGNMAFAGDGGPALQASFDTPVGMAMDAVGNLFVADLFNARIRRIAPPLVPAVAGGGIVNGASFVSGGLVPGEMATIFGSNLTSATGINPALSLPLGTELQNVEVKINGNPVPLFAVDNVNGQQQINFQAPWELAGQSSARLKVVNYGTSSPTISVPVLAAQPGIFSYQTAGKTFGAILHANYQLADTGHPAAGGEVVLIYCTSLGAVSPQAQTGAAATGAELTVAKPTVTIGGAPAAVNFSGLAPGFVGLNQINTQVPSGLAPGNQPVVITISGASSSPVLLPVQ